MYVAVKVVAVFFFFKQETAYEMRISDWSSDVCSSDLAAALAEIESDVNAYIRQNDAVETRLMTPDEAIAEGAMALFGEKYGDEVRVVSMGRTGGDNAPIYRSEEHTSELQSLMRISYAVFCLKKITTTEHILPREHKRYPADR